MQVIVHPGRVVYVAGTGDWRLEVTEDRFTILPQVGGLEYESGRNLSHLAELIMAARTDAIARGIHWDRP